MIEKGKLEKVVEEVLICSTEARNYPKVLVWAVWERMGFITYNGSREERCIGIKDFIDAPSGDSITRLDRKFKQQGLYLPTLESVAKHRRMKIRDWQHAMGYNVNPIEFKDEKQEALPFGG